MRADLERLLARREPLAACAHCLGTSGPELPHRLVDLRGVGEWRAEDDGAAIAAARAKLTPNV